MNISTTVTPCVGFYEVSTVEGQNVQVHQVGKDRRCSCGGTGKHPCRHIRAVVSHLRAGGERAAERLIPEDAPQSGPAPPFPATCPICDAPITREGRGRWRCPDDPSHFFWWLGERNGGAVRKFFTQAHPSKAGAFYEQSLDEREAFLSQIHRPHIGFSPNA